MHSHYKKLCALASTGELDIADRVNLEEHLAFCVSCRELVADLDYLRFGTMPILAARRVEESPVDAPSGIRDRFLERLGTAALTSGSQGAKPAKAVRETSNRRTEEAKSESSFVWWAGLWPKAIFISMMCLTFGLYGYYVAKEHHRELSSASSSSVIPSPPVRDEQSSRVPPDPIVNPLRFKLEEVSAQLRAAEADKRKLTEDLALLSADAIRRDAQVQEQLRMKSQALQEADDLINKLQGDLDATRNMLADRDAIQVAQQQTTQDLMAKLKDTERQLQHEQENQLSGSQAAQLIAARNLHIIDVRESEPGGKQQPAFGRVFYVEGRSLVFYAYDLGSNSHPNHPVVFRVWGETAGVKQTSHSLGILHSDDPGQARWVLSFDDPKVLKVINAVYITADQDDKAKSEPQGRRLLYAFLGSANHP